METKLQQSFSEVLFAFLEDPSFLKNENLAFKLRTFESVSENCYYVSFLIYNSKTVVKSFKLAECMRSERANYCLIVNIFLTRLYSVIDKHGGSKKIHYVHLCPECERMHLNGSLYFNRNYICNKCLSSENKKPETRGGAVYFLESELTGLIKIGFSGNIMKRKKQIENMQGGKLNLLAKIDCSSQSIERYLHERFGHLRQKGEWFSPDKELVEFCRNIEYIDSDNGLIKMRSKPVESL